MRVLVADDDAEVRDLVADAVTRMGADVVRASSGLELHNALVASEPFDAVVTDITMPQGTGLEVMESARAAGIHWPVVIMTALRDHAITARVAALGAHVALLEKPFSLRALRGALRDCLGDAALGLASLDDRAYPLAPRVL